MLIRSWGSHQRGFLQGIHTLLLVFVCLSFGVLSGCAGKHPWRSLPERELPYDLAWRVLQNTASNRYPHYVVNDQKRGYIQSDWREEKVGIVIGTPINRTRLLLWVVKRSPVQIYVKVERQTYSLPLGRWLDATTEDDPLLLEVAEDINAKLQRF